jgi:hypothetical protein
MKTLRKLRGNIFNVVTQWIDERLSKRPKGARPRATGSTAGRAGAPANTTQTSGRVGSLGEEHADERTIRRTAEAELGGVSSEESREAYLKGENPGGLHHGGKGPVPHGGQRESKSD